MQQMIETTWQLNKSEDYFNLYINNEQVVEKIYFCLDDCKMTDSQAFYRKENL